MSWYIKCPITFMRWPCAEWYHVPSLNELQSLYSILLDFWFISIGTSAEYTVNNFSNIEQCLLAPSQWDLWFSNGNYETRANNIRWLSCTSAADAVAYSTYISSSSAYLNRYSSFTTIKTLALAIRPFKDTVVIPDNNWTVLYQWTWSAWFYHNSALWLISASSDWTNWITFADKNLWATNVYTSWATLSEANCWKLYQWWNNYWFTWWVNASSKSWNQVDASKKWPWNYYSSSTFIYRSTTPYWWDSSNNANLRWWSKDLKNAYPQYTWKPGKRLTGGESMDDYIEWILR